jgi:hypothetical protein
LIEKSGVDDGILFDAKDGDDGEIQSCMTLREVCTVSRE